MNSIENNICEAIEVIVDKAVSEASFDKTILATVISCVDKTVGKYKVRYQDSIFYAYTDNVEVLYPDGSSVYVLVPGNDMDKEKIILRTTKKTGLNYNHVISDEEKFSIIGNNCFNEGQFEGDNIPSLPENRENYKILYNKDDEINLIGLDIEKINNYIKKVNHFLCAATFKTSFLNEQSSDIDFGILLSFRFNNDVIKDYIINVNNMIGNPYNQTNETRQYNIFEIDGKNIQELIKVEIFTKNINENKKVYINNFELYGIEMLTDSQLNENVLILSTPQGLYFNNNGPTKLTLQAQIRVRGKNVNNDTQTTIPFYWFKENASIFAGDGKFNKYGGPGWECLNAYNSTNTGAIEWVPGSYIYSISNSDVSAKETRYKCVAIYEESILTKEITIYNLGKNINISINSSNGTIFYYDIGETTLTCTIANEDTPANLGYLYVWSKNDSSNNFERISIGEENQIKIDDLSEIINFSTYNCSVYKKRNGNTIQEQLGDFLGTQSILITNSFEPTNSYSLVIENGTQLFKYDENGISPAYELLKEPIEISPLKFKIYDNLGNELKDSDIENKYKIRWEIPTENTLLIIDRNNFNPLSSNSLNYKIENIFNPKKTNNNIRLTVDFQGTILKAETNFLFTKDKDIQTNGGSYFLKIVPNTKDDPLPNIPIIYVNENDGDFILNYSRPENEESNWFRAELWHNEECLFNGFESNESVNLEWMILKHDSDISNLICSGANFSYQNVNGENICNIVLVSAFYNGMTYYAEMPVIVEKIFDNESKIQLKENTGFLSVEYDLMGKNPKYNIGYPFELTLDIGSYYNWSVIGSQLIEISQDKNIISLKPKDYYNGYDLYNAIKCEIFNEENQKIIEIHIPIYFYIAKNQLVNINSWNNNFIKINTNSTGLIPQMGYGFNNGANFSGIFMGNIKEGQSSIFELGNYYNGVKNFYLNSNTGAVGIGNQESGIIFNPKTNVKEINIGCTEDGNGLKIDFQNSTIKSINNKFLLDRTGAVKLTFGSIGGHAITENGLQNSYGGFLSNNNTVFWAGGTLDSPSFQVSSEGVLKIQKLKLGDSVSSLKWVYLTDANGASVKVLCGY